MSWTMKEVDLVKKQVVLGKTSFEIAKTLSRPIAEVESLLLEYGLRASVKNEAAKPTKRNLLDENTKRKIAELYQQGHGLSRIAEMLKLPKETVNHYLHYGEETAKPKSNNAKRRLDEIEILLDGIVSDDTIRDIPPEIAVKIGIAIGIIKTLTKEK